MVVVGCPSLRLVVEVDLPLLVEERAGPHLVPIPSFAQVAVVGYCDAVLDPTHYCRQQDRCPKHPLAPSCRRRLMAAVAVRLERAGQTASWRI